MAYDAGMLACVLHEIETEALGARIEKVYQPENDEVVLSLRAMKKGLRIVINVSSNNPRLGITGAQKDNPMNPPMFCMLLRKHLNGAKLAEVKQAGFERVAFLVFDTRDEMGFECRRILIAEIMGKYSNLIFTDESFKILSAIKNIDFSTSSKRQVLPGMTYSLPPAQDKCNPLEMDREGLLTLYNQSFGRPCDKFITSSFLGISAAVAREISYRATGQTDALLHEENRDSICREIEAVVAMIQNKAFSPSLVWRGSEPIEYAFLPLSQYNGEYRATPYESAGYMLDLFFEGRDREHRTRQRAADVLKILTNAEARIRRKLELQEQELAECAKGEWYQKCGDLITANLYALQRGMAEATLIDYSDYREDGTFGTCRVELDTRLSPSDNAQRMYKKYAKTKTAKVELARQMELGRAELAYIYTVFDALTRADTFAELAEIRDELYRSGYASRMKNYTAPKHSSQTISPAYRTDGGYLLYCGKNNLQNEYITHKLADKTDYWFHVKNMPGSHVVMICHGEEPSELDFTQAAQIAAYCSKAADGHNVAVDYTLIKHVKKPPAAKPGYVIYHTNWTAYVTPSRELADRLKIKK